MTRYVALYYPLDENTPCYPGTPPVRIEAVKEIGKGDAANTFLVTLSNHAGTHIDAPAHFYSAGRRIGEYSQCELNFTRPLIVDCPKGAEEAIAADDLKRCIGRSRPDMLLLRTNFSRYRNAYPDLYKEKNPYLSPETCKWLKMNCPALKAIGIDIISISSSGHKEQGREAHRILLDEKSPGNGIVIIEDMFLSQDLKKLDGVSVFPLVKGKADSSPCVVIGTIND